MKGMCSLCGLSYVLVIIGALNWGLVAIGAFAGTNLNVVNLLLGSWPTVEWIVYLLVGIAGVLTIFSAKCSCKHKM